MEKYLQVDHMIKQIRIWDFGKAEVQQILSEHSHNIECLAFSPASLTEIQTPDGNVYKGKPEVSGNFLASGSRDKLIKIWQISTGQCILTLEGHDNWVRGVKFHPSGKYLISISDDKSIRVWDFKQGRAIKTINDAHSHFISCMDFLTTKPTLVTGGVDNLVKIWGCH